MLLSRVSLRTCRVTCQDLEGVEHSVEVVAESLYEAVARGLRAFQASAWVGEIGQGLTTVTVEVRDAVPEKAEVQASRPHERLSRSGSPSAGIRPRRSQRSNERGRSWARLSSRRIARSGRVGQRRGTGDNCPNLTGRRQGPTDRPRQAAFQGN